MLVVAVTRTDAFYLFDYNSVRLGLLTGVTCLPFLTGYTMLFLGRKRSENTGPPKEQVNNAEQSTSGSADAVVACNAPTDVTL